MEEILPNIKSSGEDIKEIFLEYCNENHKTEIYQTQLMQLYLDKLFNLTGKEKQTKKLEGNAKNYYQFIMAIINSKDSVFDKKLISEYIENSWLKEPKVILYSQLKEFNKALEYLFNESKETLTFDQIEEYCEKNNDNSGQNLFENFYKLLGHETRENQDKIDYAEISIEKTKNNLDEENPNKEIFLKEISENEEIIKQSQEKKKALENEMLKILNNYGSIDTFDPMIALDYTNEHLNICKKKDFFNYLNKVVTDFTIKGNKFKITKNLSEIGLAYKTKEDYDLKKNYVTIDSDSACELCKKKIGSTTFVVYPNMRVYHSKCAPNINIEPLTGIDFSKNYFI